MRYCGPPCTRLQDDPVGLLSVPQSVHRYGLREVVGLEPVAPVGLEQADFERVHHLAYVREVVDAAMRGTNSSAFAAVAAYSMESCNIHYAASLAAMGSGFAIALAGDCGRSGYGSGAPPCLLNALLVTAARLLHEGRVQRVLILDGNAQRSAPVRATIQHLGLSCVEHVSLAAADVDHDAQRACERMEAAVLGFVGELVMYQCGTDCCGSVSPEAFLSEEQWEDRHERLAGALQQRGMPCVVNVGASDWRPNACILTGRALRRLAPLSPSGSPLEAEHE